MFQKCSKRIELPHCARVTVSDSQAPEHIRIRGREEGGAREMAAVCVPEASCANLCEELGKELETHCFVHIVEIDEVANYAVPTF